MTQLKVSVVTPVYNGASTISSCIESVLNQTYSNIEYIIVDGKSKDNTLEIIKGYPSDRIKVVSESDRGLYDAINKGIMMASGDIVCFLCADDMYAHSNVMGIVAETFNVHPEAEIVYSDILYVNREDTSKVVRYWKSSDFKPGLYKKGWLPPNTSFFTKRTALLKYGLFNIDFKLAADYELNYRLLEKNRLKSVYLPEILVKMRTGGVSNSGLINVYRSLKDCYDVLIFHKVRNPMTYIVNTMLYRLKQVYIPKEIRKIH